MFQSKHIAALATIISIVVAQKSTLPPAAQAAYNVSTRVEIDAPVEAVWKATIDFATYPSWNPFVRYVVQITSNWQTKKFHTSDMCI
jgi:uncharacterized membrane protein